MPTFTFALLSLMLEAPLPFRAGIMVALVSVSPIGCCVVGGEQQPEHGRKAVVEAFRYLENDSFSVVVQRGTVGPVRSQYSRYSSVQ